MDINWVFKLGELSKIRVVNRSDSAHPMQHPIHFHGNRFIVLSRDGVAQDNLAWKDSALIRTGETMDVVLENANPGEWMGHCHIAEHLTSGMMFGFQVKN
jgi:FtsP/CotA-like multicopper oxidase with cupredoxin domain